MEKGIVESLNPDRNMSPLEHDILRGRRQYFIRMVKAPFRWLLVFFARRYPEPTRENTKKQNVHVLLDVWDEFFKYDTCKIRKPLFLAIRKVILAEYEHDPYYEERMNWFFTKLFEKVQSGEWEPSPPWSPTTFWSNPESIEALAMARMEYAVKCTPTSEG